MCHLFRLESWRLGCGRKRRYAFAEAGLQRYGCRRRTICYARMWIATWRRTTSTRRPKTSLEGRRLVTVTRDAELILERRFRRHWDDPCQGTAGRGRQEPAQAAVPGLPRGHVS